MTSHPPYGDGHPEYLRAVDLAGSILRDVLDHDPGALMTDMRSLIIETGGRGIITAMIGWADLFASTYSAGTRAQFESGELIPQLGVADLATGQISGTVDAEPPQIQFAVQFLTARLRKDDDMCVALVDAIPHDQRVDHALVLAHVVVLNYVRYQEGSAGASQLN